MIALCCCRCANGVNACLHGRKEGLDFVCVLLEGRNFLSGRSLRQRSFLLYSAHISLGRDIDRV